MNLVLTGQKGMLGSLLKTKLESLQHKVLGIDLPEFDLTDASAITKYLMEQKIDLIYNCAAFTNVDLCETEQDKAYAVNATVVGTLGKIAKAKNIPLVHISTDYVFNGQATTPYQVDQPVQPVSVYGKTKAAGEKLLLEAAPKSFIIRTAWLYGHNGKNFVDTIIKLAQEKSELKVVNDQTGSPTYVEDLANTLTKFIGQTNYGIYHCTNSGVTTWYGLATEIVKHLGLTAKVVPCKTEEFPRPARRPGYSVLSLDKLQKVMGIEMPDWKDALYRYLESRKK